MRTIFSIFLITMFCAGSAFAANTSVKFNNKSVQALNVVTATPKDSNTTSLLNILTASISPNSVGQANIATTSASCVFMLNFTFASGKIVTRPDMDICHTTDIIVE
jgi:hypothetical protein